MSAQYAPIENKTANANSGCLSHLVRLLLDRGPMTAGTLGFELWGTKAQACKTENAQATMFCRPAGALLARAKALDLVYRCYDFDRHITLWYARPNNLLSLNNP